MPDNHKKATLKRNSPLRNITHIAARIIALRKEFKISQKELGRNLGVSQAAMQMAEKSNGTLLYEAVIFFAENKQVNPGWIMMLDNKGIPKFIDKKAATLALPMRPVEDDISSKEIITLVRKYLRILETRVTNTPPLKKKKLK